MNFDSRQSSRLGGRLDRCPNNRTQVRNFKFHNPDGTYFVSFAGIDWRIEKHWQDARANKGKSQFQCQPTIGITPFYRIEENIL